MWNNKVFRQAIKEICRFNKNQTYQNHFLKPFPLKSHCSSKTTSGYEYTFPLVTEEPNWKLRHLP